MLAYIWQIVTVHASSHFLSHFLLGSSVVFFMGFFFSFIYPTYIIEESQRLSFPGDRSLKSMEVTGSKQVKKETHV